VTKSTQTISDVNVDLTEYWLIQNDDCRMATMQTNEMTNIDYQKKKRHLILQHNVTMSLLDREISIWQKKLENLKLAKTKETKAMQNLRRRCENQRRIIQNKKSTSQMELLRKQSIAEITRFDMLGSRSSSAMSLLSRKSNTKSLTNIQTYDNKFDEYVANRPKSCINIC